jgi:hypothetical protein
VAAPGIEWKITGNGNFFITATKNDFAHLIVPTTLSVKVVRDRLLSHHFKLLPSDLTNRDSHKVASPAAAISVQLLLTNHRRGGCDALFVNSAASLQSARE